MPIELFAVPIASTLLGGFIAVRCRRYIDLLIAAGAGLLLGAAFLDLLPEAMEVGLASGWTADNVLGLTLLSFFFFHLLQHLLRYTSSRFSQKEGQQKVVRRLGAGMLIFHSFRDGMAIGAAYLASPHAGYAVAGGIAAHDVADGMNTIILTAGGEKPTRTDYLFLVGDALAPFFGGVLTMAIGVNSHNSVLLLVLAAGFFLQIAVDDFLPEVRKRTRFRLLSLVFVLFGALAIYLANVFLIQPK